MPEYKNTLLNLNLKSLLEEYSGRNSLALKKKFPEHYKLISEQLSIYPKAIKKLPVFTSLGCFLTAKSYEQSSSEPLAEYKARLFKGDVFLDLSGGLGIDDIAFSRSFNSVVSIDRDPALNELVRTNLEIMGIRNVTRIDSTAEEFIKNGLSASLIYIDADRRTTAKRSIRLEESTPPVLLMSDRLFEISQTILLKLSPLIDIPYILRALRGISEIRVISLENEVKEVLVLLERGHSNLPAIHAIELMQGKQDMVFSADVSVHTEPGTDDNGIFFYEPSASLIKAGLSLEYASKKGLTPVSRNGIYLMGYELLDDFFGRSFKVISKFDFGKSAVKNYLRAKHISKANVARRNFPENVDEIRRVFKILDGGDDYLFFTTGNNNRKLFYHCKKIQ
ncbi:MAG: hypothetical protein K8I03_03265 [Ignavibacteria bacterium]|nr:hypothetical protein [Ignavibacteria bacterium]